MTNTNISTIAQELRQSVADQLDSQLSDVEEIRTSRVIGTAALLEELAHYIDGGLWSHKGPLSTNDNLTTSSFPPELNSAAIAYFSQDAFQNHELDWFYVDALIANSNKNMVDLGESLAADQSAGAFLHGFLKIVDGKYKMGLFLILMKLVKLLFVLAAIFIPLFWSANGQIQFAALSLGAIGYVLMSWHRDGLEFSNSKDRIFGHIWCVNRVYAITADKFNINWDLLERELNDTRREGVPWLSGLDVAVRARKRHQSDQPPQTT